MEASEISGVPAAGSRNGNSADPAAAEKPLRLGGMALRNGLLVHGPTAWAAAVRNRAGEIDVASGSKPDFGGNRVASIPLLRGPVRMAEAFAVVPIARRALPSARLPFEDPRVIGAAVGVTALNGAIRRIGGERTAASRELIAAALGLLPAAVALTGSELAAYHGVEHKAIAAYEQGGLDPAAVAKEHNRCGSNLIAPLIVFSIAGQTIIEGLLERPGPLARATASVAGLSLAVETFAFAERNPKSALGRAVHGGGDAIQRLLATREPSSEQLEVGAAAMDAILAAEDA